MRQQRQHNVKLYFIFACCIWTILTLTVVVDASQDHVDAHSGSEEVNTDSITDTDTNSMEGKSKDLEIEEVETEGAGGTLEGVELGSNDEDGVPGSGNQNESDPTAAAAKVFGDDTVSNLSSKEVPDGKTLASGSAVKVGRIKVACWDFRTMKHPPLTEGSLDLSGEEQEVNLSTPEASSVTSNTEEIEESISSGEESGKTEKLSDQYQNVENPVDLDSQVSDDKTTDESALDSDSKISNRTVEIVNMTTLLHEVLYSNPMLKDRGTPSNCSVVMFYATWCPFSAKAAPHFNALPRAYLPLRVAAIDSSKYKNVNTYFGILSVPSVVLFHNGKIIAKFNDTSFTLNKFAEFIEYFTDLKQEDRMNVTTKDFEGPLSSIPIKEIDWYLYMAWIFLIGCFFHYVTKSSIWKRAVDYVGTVWREAQAQHEHMD